MIDGYVYKQTAIDEINKALDRETLLNRLVRKIAVEAVKKMPSADVVEVVRCKYCVHYMPYDWMFSEVWQSQNIEDYPQNEIGCECVDHYVKPDDYCSLGERKGGEQG